MLVLRLQCQRVRVRVRARVCGHPAALPLEFVRQRHERGLAAFVGRECGQCGKLIEHTVAVVGSG